MTTLRSTSHSCFCNQANRRDRSWVQSQFKSEAR